MSDGNLDDDLLHDADDDIVTNRRHGSPNEASSRRGLTFVVIAVLAGIVLGVWMAGRQPAPTAASAPSGAAAPSDVRSSVDPITRQAELEALLAQNPNDVDAHLELGVILFNFDDVTSAKAQWNAALSLDPHSAEGWFNMGFYYLALEPPDYTATQAAWHKLIALAPNSTLASTAQNHLIQVQQMASAAPSGAPSALPTSSATATPTG